MVDIFKTTNGGIEWTKDTTTYLDWEGIQLEYTFLITIMELLLVDLARNWEIYTTTNAGTNWTQVSNIPPPSANELTGHIASAGNSVWFGTYGGGNSVYRSTDRGLTWSVARNVPGHIGFCLAFKESLNGLAVNCFEGLGNRISKTTDGGVIWSAIPNIPTTPSTYFISYVARNTRSYVITFTPISGFLQQPFPDLRSPQTMDQAG